jgi:hypothetical protein
MRELALGDELYLRIPATLYFRLDKIVYRFLAPEARDGFQLTTGLSPQESGNLLICMACRPR